MKTTKEKKNKIKILSYNIHKGFSSGNWNYVLDKIRIAIREVNPDIVFLQEVLGKHSVHEKNIEGWPITSQFEYLADEYWGHYAYGKNAMYEEGHHGNAILSRFPFIEYENTNITTNAFEKRGLLYGKVQNPENGAVFNLFCIHLNLLESSRHFQIKKVTDLIAKKIGSQEPIIFAGDFNDWRMTIGKTLREKVNLAEVFKDIHGCETKSFPSWFPTLSLDRIYQRGFTPVEAITLGGASWTALSDHLALYCTLEY